MLNKGAIHSLEKGRCHLAITPITKIDVNIKCQKELSAKISNNCCTPVNCLYRPNLAWPHSGPSQTGADIIVCKQTASKHKSGDLNSIYFTLGTRRKYLKYVERSNQWIKVYFRGLRSSLSFSLKCFTQVCNFSPIHWHFIFHCSSKPIFTGHL